MAYKDKFEEFMKGELEKQAYMRRSREKANQAREEYQRRSRTTPIGYAMRKAQRLAAYGRTRSGLNPDEKYSTERGQIDSRLTRGASRAKYARNIGDTSYEATAARSRANQRRKHEEWTRKATAEARKEAAAKEKRIQERVRVMEGGGVRVDDKPRRVYNPPHTGTAINAASNVAGYHAGQAVKSAAGVKFGATAKKYTGSKLGHLIKGDLPKGAIRNSAKNSVISAAKTGAAKPMSFGARIAGAVPAALLDVIMDAKPAGSREDIARYEANQRKQKIRKKAEMDEYMEWLKRQGNT